MSTIKNQHETSMVQSEAIRDKNLEIFAKLEKDKIMQQKQA